MNNPAHVEVVRGGLNHLEQWRLDNAGVKLECAGADLRGADLCFTTLGVPGVREGVYHSSTVMADFSGADLSGAQCTGAFLEGVCFRGANLSGASLEYAKLGMADLREANLRGADLHGSDLFGCNLGNANLMQSHLIGACIWNAALMGADLRGATLGWTNLCGARLETAKGLGSMINVGPSSIDAETVGRLALAGMEDLLRALGVGEALIAAASRDMELARKYRGCFISHSHKDAEFVEYLRVRLQNEGIRVWYAPVDLLGGRSLIDEIRRAIREHAAFMFVASENSLNSNWVREEFTEVVSENIEKLMPVRICDWELVKSWECFDADSGRELARLLRSRRVLDFSHWPHIKDIAMGFSQYELESKAAMRPFEREFELLRRSLALE